MKRQSIRIITIVRASYVAYVVYVPLRLAYAGSGLSSILAAAWLLINYN